MLRWLPALFLHEVVKLHDLEGPHLIVHGWAKGLSDLAGCLLELLFMLKLWKICQVMWGP